MKKIYASIVVMVLCICFCAPAYAADLNAALPAGLYYVDQITADDDFIEYVNTCFEDVDNFRIINETGNDVTFEIFPLIQEKFQSNDLDGLAQYVARNGYVLAHKITVQPYSLTKSYYEEFSGYKVDKEYGKYMLKWNLHMSSTYVTDTAETTILSAANPTVGGLSATTTNSGVYFESNGLPTINYFKPLTPSIINNGKEVQFAGDVQISATFAGNTDWGPIGKELYFILPRLSGSATV